MRKKIILATASAIAIFIFYHTYVYTNATGAPAFRTGAPGELTCATSDCHYGNSVMTNSADVQISVMDNGTPITVYTPGKKYDVRVSISNGSGSAYGFEATVKDKNKIHQGTLGLGTDPNVQLIDAKYYATHTYPTAVSDGHGEWDFQWTAPSADKGTVTIYTAVNAANGDGTSYGDQIHTKSLDIFSASTGVSQAALFVQNISLYPNPVENTLHANLSLPEEGQLHISLLDLNGKIIKDESYGNKSQGPADAYMDMTGLARGFYLVRISCGANQAVEKIFKN